MYRQTEFDHLDHVLRLGHRNVLCIGRGTTCATMLVAVAVGSGPGVKRHGCGRAAEAWLRGCLSSIVESVLPRRRRRCERQSPNFVVLAPRSSSPPFSVPQEGPRRRILEVVAITLQGAIALPLACAMLWPMGVEAARRPMRWGPGSGGGPARGGSALKSRGGAAGESGLESAAAGLGSTAVAGPCTGRVGEGGGGADSATLAAGPLCERGTAAACEHTRVCAAGRADRPQHGDGTGRPTLPDGWEGRPTGCRRLPRCRGCAPPAPLARPARAADRPSKKGRGERGRRAHAPGARSTRTRARQSTRRRQKRCFARFHPHTHPPHPRSSTHPDENTQARSTGDGRGNTKKKKRKDPPTAYLALVNPITTLARSYTK